MIRELYPVPRDPDDQPAAVLLECDVCRFNSRIGTPFRAEEVFEGAADWHRLFLPNRGRIYPEQDEVHFCSTCWPGSARLLTVDEARTLEKAADSIRSRAEYHVESAEEVLRCDLLSIVHDRAGK